MKRKILFNGFKFLPDALTKYLLSNRVATYFSPNLQNLILYPIFYNLENCVNLEK